MDIFPPLDPKNTIIITLEPVKKITKNCDVPICQVCNKNPATINDDTCDDCYDDRYYQENQ